MAITILKASGQPEKFDMQKLVSSLIRSGAPADIAEDIAGEVAKKTLPNAKTKEIYRMARTLLKHYNLAAGMRYSLKKALSSLGPSGYPFEQYVGRILQGHGYAVEVGKIIKGYCVNHEVDVLAINGNAHFIMECKYHSDGGKPTDVKVALYVHSRFNDIKRAIDLSSGHGAAVPQGWLVTNTRCTTDAIRYAECVGLRIMSWRYPENGSLEKMIEGRRLYPATILPSARRKSLEALFRNNFILAQDIADVDEDTFLRKSGLDHRTARAIKREADELCPCIPENEAAGRGQIAF